MPSTWKKSRRAKWREIKVDGEQYRWRVTIDRLETEVYEGEWVLPGHERHKVCMDELIARGLYKIGDKQIEADLLPNSKGGGAIPWSPVKRLQGTQAGKKKHWRENYDSRGLASAQDVWGPRNYGD